MAAASARWPHDAVEVRGDVAAVAAWLDGGGQVDAIPSDGLRYATMLLIASRHGHTALVDLLLARGASVDLQTGGCTALMRAAMFGQPDIVRRLLRAGARTDLRDTLAEQVEESVAKGARVLCGGEVPAGKGAYYPATVLVDVKPGQPAYDDELFGPVVCLTKFDGSEAEAVRLSNDTDYGLAAYVYTQDLVKARRCAMQIKAGQVGINNWTVASAPPSCPWIGHKASGFGYHSGEDGWRQFSSPKSLIFTDVAAMPPPPAP